MLVGLVESKSISNGSEAELLKPNTLLLNSTRLTGHTGVVIKGRSSLSFRCSSGSGRELLLVPIGCGAAAAQKVKQSRPYSGSSNKDRDRGTALPVDHGGRPGDIE